MFGRAVAESRDVSRFAARWIVVAVVVAATASCGGSDGASPTVPPPPPPTVASLGVRPGTWYLFVGDTVRLQVLALTAAGGTLPAPAITWTSSAPSTASVDGSGLVTPKDAGTAVITATSNTDGLKATATITVDKFVDLSVGPGMKCAVSATGRGFCWGYVFYGPPPLNGNWATLVATPSVIPGATQIASVQVAPNFVVCTLDHAGVASCAGDNMAGVLGRGTIDSSLTDRRHGEFAPVTGGHVFASIAPSGGGGVTCALTSDGTLYCWGSSYTGMLGVAAPSGPDCLYGPCIDQPLEVSTTLRFRQVSVGGYHVCGIEIGGAADCWGVSMNGDLGVASTTRTCYPSATFLPFSLGCNYTPHRVDGGLSFVSIAAGFAQTCAVASGGGAYCWGDNTDGQLGNGSYSKSAVPVPVAGNIRFSTVVTSRWLGPGPSTFSQSSCGVAVDGTAYCWGDNSSGQLGNGTQTSSPVPVAVSGRYTFRSVGISPYYGCGLSVDGVVYCWGENAQGELGNAGSASVYLTPMRVVTPAGAAPPG